MPPSAVCSSWSIGRRAASRRALCSARSAGTSGTITPSVRGWWRLWKTAVSAASVTVSRAPAPSGASRGSIVRPTTPRCGPLASRSASSPGASRSVPSTTTRWIGSGRSTSSSARVSMSCLIDLIAAAQPSPSVAMLQPWSPLNVCGSQRAKPHSAPVWSRVSTQMRSSVGECVAASDSTRPRAAACARPCGPTRASDPVASRLVSSGVPHCSVSSSSSGSTAWIDDASGASPTHTDVKSSSVGLRSHRRRWRASACSAATPAHAAEWRRRERSSRRRATTLARNCGELGGVLLGLLLAPALGLLLPVDGVDGDQDRRQRHHGEEDPASGDRRHADAGEQREQGPPPVGAGARRVDVGGTRRLDVLRQRRLGGAELAGEDPLRRPVAEDGELAVVDVDDGEHRAAGVHVVAGGERDGAVDRRALDHRAVRRAGVGQRRAPSGPASMAKCRDDMNGSCSVTSAPERPNVSRSPSWSWTCSPLSGSGDGDDVAAGSGGRVLERRAARSRCGRRARGRRRRAARRRRASARRSRAGGRGTRRRSAPARGRRRWWSARRRRRRRAAGRGHRRPGGARCSLVHLDHSEEDDVAGSDDAVAGGEVDGCRRGAARRGRPTCRSSTRRRDRRPSRRPSAARRDAARPGRRRRRRRRRRSARRPAGRRRPAARAGGARRRRRP